MRGRSALRAAGLSLVVVLIGMAEIAYGRGPGLNRPTIPQVAVILVGAAALLRRRRDPRAVAVVTVLCGTALPFLSPHQVVTDAATVVALYTVAEATDRRTAAALGTVAAGLLTASSMLWLPHHFFDIRNVLPINYVTVAIALGDAVRTQRALLHEERLRTRDAEQSREDEVRRQVREERIRIARDLHDVVAHHVTLVNAQAGVAHHLLRTDPDRAYQALTGIEENSRAALDELRATVGLLRADDEPDPVQPVPSLTDLDGLLGSFRGSGLRVRLTRHGMPRAPTRPADLAAYRIIQEALTNAAKHAALSEVELDLTYTAHTLTLTVTNPAVPGRGGPGTGHGLIGMRERTESAGGRFTAGFEDGSRFVVRADLPLTALPPPALPPPDPA